MTAHHDEQAALIGRAQNGDEDALAQLLEAHTERLLASIRTDLGGHLRQRLESQDVMQQVYVDALRSIGRFEQRGNDAFFAWLRRIALNRICDADRRNRAGMRKGEVRVGDLGHEASAVRLLDRIEGSVTSPSMRANKEDQVRRLERALGELGEAQRRAINLRYFERRSVAETAEQMGRTERAVRGLCVRALVHLRELLGDDV